MTPEEQELPKQARRLDKADVIKLITQARAIADLIDEQDSEERVKEMRAIVEQNKKRCGSNK